ncbi:tyrosyl-tRNA synthetase [Entophlyctis sp. JEL0112]|nr:tyrosyl-tRNA synthetase [Entophlyctis sp. JEL0112]
MLARESVKARMDTPHGISFVEFTYQLLQAYDFWWLWKNEGVTVQIGNGPITISEYINTFLRTAGGSDQWGNIVAGMELIRKLGANQLQLNDSNPASDSTIAETEDNEMHVFGVTLPLLTTSTGEKFGKSAGNAIWLDPGLCSPFDFYQFFRRTPDAVVESYLACFTFLSLAEIAKTMATHQIHPELHAPQRLLAYEVTHLVHGQDAADISRVKAHVLFDSHVSEASSTLTASDVLRAFDGDDRLFESPRNEIFGCNVIKVAVAVGLVKSFS